MSVVAARIYSHKIVMAADSIVCKGSSKTTNGDFAKINKDNGMIVGATGECEETSLLWHFMRTRRPDGHSEKDILAYMVEFSKWKRETIGDSSISNSYLMIFEGHLFLIDCLFVAEVKDFFAIGAGEDFANAAMYLGHSPKEAVRVSCALSCYAAEPIIEYEWLFEE